LSYTASSLLAEVRHLANPVTLDTSSLSEDVEDVSSNAAVALQFTERSAKLTRTILAIEAVTAAELAAAAPLGAPLQSVVDLVSFALDDDVPAEELVARVERELY
jgi:histidine ammonia-lyase